MKSKRPNGSDAQALHEDYLIRLEKRNQFYKQNDKIDPLQAKLREREENFSVYVNGANAIKPPSKSFTQTNLKTPRGLSSALQGNRLAPFSEEYHKVGPTERSQSAPSWGRRKYWGQSSVEIKTNSGDKVRLERRDNMNYSDIFCSDDSSIEEDLGLSGSQKMTSMSDDYVSEDSDLVEGADDSMSSKMFGASINSEKKSYHGLETNSISHSTQSKPKYASRAKNEPSRTKSMNELKILVFSNWHRTDKRIGLTELRLIDEYDTVLPVEESDISVTNASIAEGDLNNLCNEVVKTTKNKNMVLFNPTSLPFCINVKYAKGIILNKITLWNFNAPSELNVGVKSCKILLNDETLFEGDIEKGCGNKIFDYGFTINIDKECSKHVKVKLPWEDESKTPRTKSKMACNFQKEKPFGDEIMLEEDKTRTGAPKLRRKEREREKSHLMEPERNQDSPEQTGLDQSLKSLSFFNHSHLGRLETSVDFESDFFEKRFQAGGAERTGDGGLSTQPKPKTEFEIPVLPEGKNLTVNIRSTWGDIHYVGLNGIEVFGEDGMPVQVTDISADPPDVNILNKYGSDPRVVGNLVDGNYRTKDDFRMWLTPFTQGSVHSVFITFKSQVKVAMIRVWNYNKSRIHSYRGAKDVDITLDDKLIFEGQIAKASGTLDMNNFGDTILFTTDDHILEMISEHDKEFSKAEKELEHKEIQFIADRPNTGRGRRSDISLGTEDDSPRDPSSVVSEGDTEPNAFCAKKIELQFLSTWGDTRELGLTGVELIVEENEPSDLSSDMISIQYTNSAKKYRFDSADLENICNGNNVSTLDADMMLLPYEKGCKVSLFIRLTQARQVNGIRVWNYNRSAEDSYKGVKSMLVFLDDNCVTPPAGVILRRAPGNLEYDFAQDISFSSSHKKLDVDSDKSKCTDMITSRVRDISLISENESSTMPTGFVFQLQILNSISDPYYVGLTGLEVFDSKGRKIKLTENNVAAFPESVNILNDISDDVRTPDKIIDGVNETYDGQHMWLCPLLPHRISKVFIIFDQPVTVSMIKIWNYAKTPSRGVKDFALVVDDLLIYNGSLHPAIKRTGTGIVPGCNMKQSKLVPSLISFTKEREIISKAGSCRIVSDVRSDQQDIRLTDNHHIVNANHDQIPNQDLRPMTTVRRTTKAKIRSRF